MVKNGVANRLLLLVWRDALQGAELQYDGQQGVLQPALHGMARRRPETGGMCVGCKLVLCTEHLYTHKTRVVHGLIIEQHTSHVRQTPHMWYMCAGAQHRADHPNACRARQHTLRAAYL